MREPSEYHGRDAAVARERALLTAFPDAVIELGPPAVIGDSLTFEGTLRGTHAGALRLGATTVPASGRAIELRFAAVFEFGDGVARRERVYYDRLDVLAQLGVVAPGALP